METETKKISFGFSKLAKKPSIIARAPVEEKKIELVECFEGQTIKIKDAVEEVFEPLVIPIHDSNKNLLDRIKEARARQKDAIKIEVVKEETDERPDSELTMNELAARELIREAKNRLNQKVAENKVFMLPDNESTERTKESTLEDYESIPISDFGKAMLRGMGWNEETTKSSTASEPELRPKGLGLGANKLVKEKPKEALDKDGKPLILIRGAFAKIIAGNNKGTYCEVQGLDDEAGRVIVRTSLKGEILTLNEFLIVPVTKEEYTKFSKILNNAKYEEYKEISDKKLETYHNNRQEDGDRVSQFEEKNYNRSSRYESENSENDKNHHRIKTEKYKTEQYADSSDTEKDDGDKTNGKDRSQQRNSRTSSDTDDKERSRRRNKKDKSKYRDRSRSNSNEESRRRSKKKSKSKSRHRSPSSDIDYKKKKSKKNKCKSRHRRSSSSETDREYNRRHDKKGKR